MECRVLLLIFTYLLLQPALWLYKELKQHLNKVPIYVGNRDSQNPAIKDDSKDDFDVTCALPAPHRFRRQSRSNGIAVEPNETERQEQNLVVAKYKQFYRRMVGEQENSNTWHLEHQPLDPKDWKPVLQAFFSPGRFQENFDESRTMSKPFTFEAS
jgi:hypothetical protein